MYSETADISILADTRYILQDMLEFIVWTFSDVCKNAYVYKETYDGSHIYDMTIIAD